MEIFFAANNEYSQHLCTAMVSIAENNPLDVINFHILTDGISDANKEKIALSLKKYDFCSIDYTIVKDERLNNLKLNISYISVQTYYRYLIPELFPNLNKALYLDCDIIVNYDLYSLWLLREIKNVYIAGAEDIYIKNSPYLRSLGWDSGEPYINAGVLLMNLAKMREDHITEKLLENTVKYAETIKYQDQDILNITCKGKIHLISERYNFTSDNVKSSDKKHIASLNPAIIHYTGAKKPWNYGCKNQLKNLYFKYLKLTAFRNFKYLFIWETIRKTIFYKDKGSNFERTQILGIKLPKKNIKQ